MLWKVLAAIMVVILGIALIVGVNNATKRSNSSGTSQTYAPGQPVTTGSSGGFLPGLGGGRGGGLGPAALLLGMPWLM